MLTLTFLFLIVTFIAGVIKLSAKLAWGVGKLIFAIASTLIIGALLVSGGFVVVAIVLLVLAGIGGAATAATA